MIVNVTDVSFNTIAPIQSKYVAKISEKARIGLRFKRLPGYVGAVIGIQAQTGRERAAFRDIKCLHSKVIKCTLPTKSTTCPSLLTSASTGRPFDYVPLASPEKGTTTQRTLFKFRSGVQAQQGGYSNDSP